MRRALLAALVVAMLAPVAARASTSEAWSDLALMSTERFSPVSALLPDGRVLVAAGDHHAESFQKGQRVVEIFDPAAGTWARAADLNDPRGESAALVPLPDGRLFIIDQHFANGEIYDPSSNTWSRTSAASYLHDGTSAAALPDGRVLVAGRGAPFRYGDAEIYDPATDTWTVAARPFGARAGAGMVSLPTGEVLWIGCTYDGEHYATSELYDPVFGHWTLIPMNEHRCGATVTLMSDGRVLVTGGVDWRKYPDPIDTASTEIFDPTTLRWTPTATMSRTRDYHEAVSLPDGSVLAIGGDLNEETERYHPSTDRWVSGGRMQRRRTSPAATVMPDGRLLVAGGYDGLRLANTSEIYDPRRARPSTLFAPPFVPGGAVAARLTDAGTDDPVVGATIRFRSKNLEVCTALTGSDGWARCEVDARWALLPAGLGTYTATFAGTFEYRAAEAWAPIIET